METLSLTRVTSMDIGTIGVAIINKFKFISLELPYRANRSNISCIPVGVYDIMLRTDLLPMLRFQLSNVPNRSFIQIHAGFFAGDKSLGYRSSVLGCILLGHDVTLFNNQFMLLNSVEAINLLYKTVGEDVFKIIIT